LRGLIKAKRAKAVIPSNRTRKKLIRHDKAIYKMRNQIERCINRLKNFRRFATRYDRRASRFLAFIHLACAMQWEA
jgi:transposase